MLAGTHYVAQVILKHLAILYLGLPCAIITGMISLTPRYAKFSNKSLPRDQKLNFLSCGTPRREPPLGTDKVARQVKLFASQA